MSLFIDMEDPDVILDLRHHSGNAGIFKYDAFWDACDKFLNEETATDDRRHGTITHMARAISIRDLRSQVEKQLPPDTPLPAIEWLRLQFWPKNKANTNLQYTGRFKVKYKGNYVTHILILIMVPVYLDILGNMPLCVVTSAIFYA